MGNINFGIGYMGSKSTIAPWVVQHLPAAPVLVDLFAGGCAITHAAMLSGKYQAIIANDITDAPLLFAEAVQGKFHNEKRWISREDYASQKATEPYVRYCWSFGNNGKNYLYSEKIEPYKRACHYAIVFDEWEPLKELCPEVWQAARAAMKGCKTQHQRRLAFGPAIVLKLKALGDASLLDTNPLYGSCHKRGGSFSLESLERLQSLGIIANKHDYREVEIPEGAVVYCDPPYKGTADYINAFDSEAFYQWVRDCEHPVYFSEYSAPKDFLRVAAIQKSNRLSSKGSKANNYEFIFWNGK